MSLWLRSTETEKSITGQLLVGVFHRKMVHFKLLRQRKRPTVSLVVSPSNKEILKVSQQVESNRLRTRLRFWWCLHLVGFQVATRLTALGCSAAGSAHWSPLSWDAVSPPSTRDLPRRRQRNRFLHFSSASPPPLSKEAPVCLVIQRARWRSNFYPSENG